MRRPALLLLLALFSVTWGLASCSQALPAALAPTATATEARADTATPFPTPNPSSTAGPTSPVPSPTLTRTATPAGPPTARPIPSPTLPPRLTPDSGARIPLSLGWRLDANGHLAAGQIVRAESELAYVLASLGRTVYGLADSGQITWHLRTQGPVYALAEVDGGLLAAGDDAGMVTLFDMQGKKLGQHDLGTRVTALHGGWQGGLLAGGWNEELCFLSAGAEQQWQTSWQADIGAPVSAITALPDLAVAATLEGHIWAFDPQGFEVWRFDAGAPVVNIGIAGQGAGAILLAGVQDGRLLALDPTGALLWQQNLGAGAPAWQVAGLINDGEPEIIIGTGGQEPTLALLSTRGDVLWRRALPALANALAAVDLDGDTRPEILAGLSSGEVQAYDAQGRIRGSVQAGLSVWNLLAAGEGSALILADVAAWKLEAGEGPQGRAWLSPPEMIPAPPKDLPTGTEKAQDEAILVFLGDVAAGRSMEMQLARYGPDHPWVGLAPLLEDADLAAANLECVLTTQGTPLDKSYLIRAHPSWGQTLTRAGFDLVTLANNHALDFKMPGLDETLATLQALEIEMVGAGPSQEAAHRPAVLDLNGVRVAVLGYAAARWNGSVDMPATQRVAWARPALVQDDVRAVREAVDIVVVLLHAGTEYASTPSADQVAVARAAIDAGADLVVGHHPHVTQTVERYKQGLIVYSLGDALFDIPRPAAMRGDLLRVHITQGGISQAELWPFWIDNAIQPRLLDDGQGRPRFEVVYP